MGHVLTSVELVSPILAIMWVYTMNILHFFYTNRVRVLIFVSIPFRCINHAKAFIYLGKVALVSTWYLDGVNDLAVQRFSHLVISTKYQYLTNTIDFYSGQEVLWIHYQYYVLMPCIHLYTSPTLILTMTEETWDYESIILHNKQVNHSEVKSRGSTRVVTQNCSPAPSQSDAVMMGLATHTKPCSLKN